jgi:DmsE family decaheme c-type cytochrome
MTIKRALAGLALGLAGVFGLAGLTLGTAAAAGVDAAGSAACVKCHDEEDLPDSKRHAHSVGTDPRTPTCITCHGASPTHVTKPADVKERPPPDRVFGKKSKTPVADLNGACLSCHQKDAKRVMWGGSQHETANLACSSCHQNHTNNDKVLTRLPQAEVCITCHKEQRTQMARPSHHPVPEGKMTCSDCHNAHGSVGPKLVKRDNTNDTCYTCHAEKRGPFVHSHEPVQENCAICHNPHGSTIAAMLKSRPPMLCNECHTPHVAGGVGAVGGQRGVFPPAAPGQTAPAVTGTSSGKNVVNIWQGRSCTNCHTQVHGSNNPSATNPTPGYLTR